MNEPRLINGGKAIDDRGFLNFVNEFNFVNVKRFYQVKNHNPSVIRAFHGHKDEEKYVYVTRGTALIILIKIDDFENPSKDLPKLKYVLSSKKPAVLHIPGGFVNGFKMLEEDSSVMFFSTKSLSESEKKDDFRFPFDYWGKDIWEVKNR